MDSRRRRFRIRWLAGLVLLPLLVLVPVALAQSGEVVHLTGEMQGDQYAAGNRVILEEGAVIHGDLLAVGSTVIVNGTVDGSVMAAGNRVEVRGPVGHAVRIAGGALPPATALIVASDIGGDLIALGSAVEVLSDASVGGNAAVFAGQVHLGGRFAGDLQSGGSEVVVAGTVQGNADLECSPCRIGPEAVITGTLTYKSASEAEIQGRVRSGSIVQVVPETPGYGAQVWLWFTGLLGMIIAGAVLIWLFPRAFAAVEEALRTRPGPCAGWGALALVGLPAAVAALIALSLLLGLLVRVMPVSIGLGAVALGCYVLSLFLSHVFVGYTIGRMLFQLLKWEGVRGVRYWQMVLGVFLLNLVGLIPPLSVLQLSAWVNLAVRLFGLGAVVVAAWRARQAQHPIPDNQSPLPDTR